jgi:hypothetical protein
VIAALAASSMLAKRPVSEATSAGSKCARQAQRGLDEQRRDHGRRVGHLPQARHCGARRSDVVALAHPRPPRLEARAEGGPVRAEEELAGPRVRLGDVAPEHALEQTQEHSAPVKPLCPARA